MRASPLRLSEMRTPRYRRDMRPELGARSREERYCAADDAPKASRSPRLIVEGSHKLRLWDGRPGRLAVDSTSSSRRRSVGLNGRPVAMCVRGEEVSEQTRRALKVIAVGDEQRKLALELQALDRDDLQKVAWRER